MKIKRFSAGQYEARDGEYAVVIGYRADLKGWIAAADWDRYLYTDPVPTYRDAKYNASIMLDSVTNR